MPRMDSPSVSQGSSEPCISQDFTTGLGVPRLCHHRKLAEGTGPWLVGGCRAIEREMGTGEREWEAGKEDGFTF